MFAAFITGHHLAISAACISPSASGVSFRAKTVPGEFAEPLLHGWIAECVLDSSVEFQDHVARRILGAQNPRKFEM